MVTRAVSSTRRLAGSIRPVMAATADSTPSSVNRRANPAAIVDGGTGTTDNKVIAGSGRCRSDPIRASAPNSWDWVSPNSS